MHGLFFEITPNVVDPYCTILHPYDLGYKTPLFSFSGTRTCSYLILSSTSGHLCISVYSIYCIRCILIPNIKGLLFYSLDFEI